MIEVTLRLENVIPLPCKTQFVTGEMKYNLLGIIIGVKTILPYSFDVTQKYLIKC